MPEKLKKSVKTFNRKTNKTSVEHFYLHTTKLDELTRIVNDDKVSPKLRMKCKRELTKRSKNEKLFK